MASFSHVPLPKAVSNFSFMNIHSNSSVEYVQSADYLVKPALTKIDSLLLSLYSSPLSSSPYALVLASLAVVMITTYFVTWTSFHQNVGTGKPRVPSIFPHHIPWFGNAFNFAFNPAGCIGSIAKAVGANGVFGIKLVGMPLYVLTGRENVRAIRKYHGHITDPGVHEFCLIRVFGVDKKAVKMYSQDDSGLHAKPAPHSSIAPHNRVDYHTHMTFLKIFHGDGLNTLFRRWHISFSRRMADMQIGTQWVEGSNFETFWMPSMVASLNEAMVGPILEAVNPNFTNDFLEFYPYAHSLMNGVAKVFMPRAIALRDSLKRDFMTWHAVARSSFRESDVEEDGTDRWWGLSAFRDRQRLFSQVDDWDHATLASLDFGLLWGTNLNSHVGAIWMVIEIFKDPVLLQRVRAELETLTTTPDDRLKWIDELMHLPLLQSIYAEVLRLRTGVQTVFRDNREDIRINQWIFPKKTLVIVPTMEAHMDETYWSTRGGKYPLNRFWADRFLAYPDDPLSGPSRIPDPAREKNASRYNRSGPRFVNVGSSDAFIPYGIGERTCPGRLFARREMVATCAMLVQGFDLELPSLKPDTYVPASGVMYGLGVLRPKGSQPFRIRRRS